MEKHIYQASDGAKISYHTQGAGEALLCVHGSGRDQSQWETSGWLAELKKHYMVITMDIRGFGESSVFHDEKFYAIDRILDDISGIMKECNVDEIRYFGHSYGATIGFQAIRAGLPIKKAVFASGSFGPQFFKEVCPSVGAEYNMLSDVKKRGAWDELAEYSKEDIDFIKGEDMEKYAAQFTAWSKWEPLTIEQLDKRISFYCGSLDHNKEMIENATIKKALFEEKGIQSKCFDGLNHEELITKSEVCLSWVLEHLA